MALPILLTWQKRPNQFTSQDYTHVLLYILQYINLDCPNIQMIISLSYQPLAFPVSSDNQGCIRV